MTIRLINARPSPYGRKIAIALKEKAIPFEVQYDVPWADTTCTPDYSPFEQLPILILDDGETVYDSSFLLEWLDYHRPEPALIPAHPEEAIAARKLQMLGERLMEFIHSVTFELQRPEPSDAWVDRQSRKVRRGLMEIERTIGSRRPVPDEPITVGDIAVGTALLVVPFLIENGFVPALDILQWRERHPGLAAYADALDQRPSFRETRPAMMDVNLSAVLA